MKMSSIHKPSFRWFDRDEMRGRWKTALPSIGIDASYLTGKRGRCPLCGGSERSDRFQFTNRNGSGSFYCHTCGRGNNGIELVMRFKRIGFQEAADLVRSVVGSSPRSSRYVSEGAWRRQPRGPTDG